MSKNLDQHKNERKKPKMTLKEKRQAKREKRERAAHSGSTPVDIVEQQQQQM